MPIWTPPMCRCGGRMHSRRWNSKLKRGRWGGSHPIFFPKGPLSTAATPASRSPPTAGSPEPRVKPQHAGAANSGRAPGIANMTRRVRQLRIRCRHVGLHGVVRSELARESAGFAGIEVQTKIFNLCVKNAFIVGHTQNLETTCAAKAAITGHEPCRNQQIVVE